MGNFTLNKIDKDSGEITGVMDCEVRAYPIAEPKGKTKGFASLTIDGAFAVHSISIIEGSNGLFASMPHVRDAKGENRDIFHPVTKEAREALQGAILSEYAVALDAMVTEKESTVQKLRDAASAAKGQTAPSAGKEQKERNKKASGPEH